MNLENYKYWCQQSIGKFQSFSNNFIAKKTFLLRQIFCYKVNSVEKIHRIVGIFLWANNPYEKVFETMFLP